MYFSTLWVDRSPSPENGSEEGYCHGHSNKKPKLERPTKGVNCTLYEAKSAEQQKHDNNVIKEMKENLDNKNIPLFRVVRNSVPPDAWCETKFGTLRLFSFPCLSVQPCWKQL